MRKGISQSLKKRKCRLTRNNFISVNKGVSQDTPLSLFINIPKGWSICFSVKKAAAMRIS